jgi:uncharacterized protein YkwD
MLRQYVPLVALALILLGGVDTVVSKLFPPSPEDLEESSSRIGWTSAMESDALARDIYVRVNDERTARLVPPLTWDEGLADLARRWSETMIAGTYEHSPPEFRASPAFAGTGENIAMGYLGAPDVHVGWMRSAGHRDNILYPGYTAVGVGVVCRNDGRLWATQIFGVPHGAYPDPPTSTAEEPVTREDPGQTCSANHRRRPAW